MVSQRLPKREADSLDGEGGGLYTHSLQGRPTKILTILLWSHWKKYSV